MAVLDYDGLLYYHAGLKNMFVAKETGKGLSTEDFTTAEKTKLDGITDATTTTSGLMTAADKTKLDGIVDATTSASGLMTATDKAKLDGFSDASTYALKSEIATAMIYKGSVATVADLPSSGNKNGDMYDVLANGHNYIWNGTDWDDCGGTFAYEAITNAQINTVLAS